MEIDYVIAAGIIVKLLVDIQFGRSALVKVDALTKVVDEKFTKVDTRLTALEDKK